MPDLLVLLVAFRPLKVLFCQCEAIFAYSTVLATARFRATLSEFPNARILVLATYAGDIQMMRAFRAGARGYLLKANVHTDLLEAIRAVHAGQKRISPEIAVELAAHAGEGELTAREVDVLRLIASAE